MEINVTYHLRKGLKIINKKNKKTKNNEQVVEYTGSLGKGF